MPIYALGDQVPDIHPDAYVHPDAVVIGSVFIGAESSVWPTAVLRGDDGEIHIGRAHARSRTARSSTRTPFHPTTVGDECTIGHKVHLEGCRIEDKALVGSGSIVLHNAVGRTRGDRRCRCVRRQQQGRPAAGAWRWASRRPSRRTRSQPGHFDLGMQSYVDRAKRYRADLRRLD